MGNVLLAVGKAGGTASAKAQNTEWQQTCIAELTSCREKGEPARLCPGFLLDRHTLHLGPFFAAFL